MSTFYDRVADCSAVSEQDITEEVSSLSMVSMSQRVGIKSGYQFWIAFLLDLLGT